MKISWRAFLPAAVIVAVTVVFFYRTFLRGLVPFPGDLLLSEYAPWRHMSYGGYVAGAVPSKGQYFDVVRELYPWKTFTVGELKQGRIPLWNPYNFSGTPHLANYQSQVFYPLGILYFFLPQKAAWTVMVVLQPLLAMLFMFLFAAAIGMGPAGAMIAAVAFGFSSFATVWMEFNTVWHTILWLPLLFYIVERGIRKGTLAGWERLLFIFAMISSATAGHPQDFINSFLFFGLYTVCRIPFNKTLPQKTRVHLSALFGLLTVTAFLIAGPQLFPTVAFFRESARVSHDYAQILRTMLVQWWQLPVMVVQDFFGNPATRTNFLNDTYVGKTLSIGATGFLLLLFSVFGRKKNPFENFFLWTSLGVLLLTVNTPFAQMFYRYPIPVLSTGTPTRVLFVLMFSMAILAGWGAERIGRASRRDLTVPMAAAAVIFLLLFSFAVFRPVFPGLTYGAAAAATMRKALMLGAAFLAAAGAAILLSVRFRPARYLLVVVVCAELFLAFNKFNPFVPAAFVFPDNPLIQYLTSQSGLERFWGYGTTHIEADFATQYGIFSPDGTDPLNLKRYNAFIQSSHDGNLAKTFTRETRSDALIAPGYGAKDLPENRFRLRIMDALNVRYVIDRSENPKDAGTFPTDRFTPVWHKEDWTVYRNQYAAPRFFVSGSWLTYRTDDEFETKFFDPAFNPATSVLIPEGMITSPSGTSSSSGTVNVVSYKPGKMRLSAHVEMDSLLFISEAYDADWKARVDGKQIPVIPADYALMSVPVSPGDHTVELDYAPPSFRAGIAAFGAGIILLIFLVAPSLKRRGDGGTVAGLHR